MANLICEYDYMIIPVSLPVQITHIYICTVTNRETATTFMIANIITLKRLVGSEGGGGFWPWRWKRVLQAVHALTSLYIYTPLLTANSARALLAMMSTHCNSKACSRERVQLALSSLLFYALLVFSFMLANIAVPCFSLTSVCCFVGILQLLAHQNICT